MLMRATQLLRRKWPPTYTIISAASTPSLSTRASVIFRPVTQWDEAGFDRSMAVNLKGPFFLIQALLPILANPASIVLNISINAHIGMPNSSVYAATKAGLLSLARTLSGELMPS
jgi:NAD(P)-dependent dehydrogenase (short-subunit alcohol dehydrogenase family)